MMTVASPANGAPTESAEQKARADAAAPSTPSDVTAATLVESAVTVTPPRQNKARPAPTSSCKRRRLVSEDDVNSGGAPASPARRLNYERRNGSDADDSTDDSSDEEDPVDREIAQERQESVLRKIRKLHYDEGGEGEDRLISKAASARLFEYVKDYDVVAAASAFDTPRSEEGGSEGVWKYRGSGHVKFIKCMEEGYNCGMIRAELIKNGTLQTLMCHELTHEEVQPMPSKKGKAYTWRCKDWAYLTTPRTFALRFDDDMDALRWKEEVERSKANNRRVRSGRDVPDVSVEALGDDVCAAFGKLSAAGPSGEGDAE